MILGLDISTSITGYTVIGNDGIVLECNHVDLKKCNDIYEKAFLIQTVLQKLYAKYEIKNVFIEESLSMFSMGKSSATVLSLLSKFNGIVSWTIYEKFNMKPLHIPAVSARKQIGLKMIKGTKGKEIVMKHMIDNEKWFNVEYTKTNKFKPFMYDRADSFVIAKAGYFQVVNNKK